MRHAKYFKQLNELSPERDIGYINSKPKRGAKAELSSAKELHALLRDYSYHLIGLGNTFRSIAALYGKFDGSYWRYYRGVRGEKLKAIANQLNAMDPYDVDAIIELERAIEALAQTLSKEEK